MANRVSVLDCELCSGLPDSSYCFSKYGHEEGGTLSGLTAKMVPVEPLDSLSKERHHVRRCTRCGTFYRYDCTYEYLVNGSEDEEELVRLTPGEARDRLSGEEYEGIIRDFEARAGEAPPKLAFYVVTSLLEHHLAEKDEKSMRRVLGAHRDLAPQILFALRHWRARKPNRILDRLIREIDPGDRASP
ncbi:MAG: hypothetical protein MUC63_02465 [Planctomycetes bacterium]|nr:hypothetical protein [Planctomycetota bacterium]